MKLIIGCGYLGRRVARRWREQGAEVAALTRSPNRAREFAAEGITPLIGDVADPQSLRELPAADTVLYAVGYDRNAGRSMHEVYVDGLRNVLDALREPARVIYISSTGVYGDFSGEWIDESAPCVPRREGGQSCLAAERLLQASRWRERAVVLRLAGIYGPGRIPRRAALLAGESIAAPEQGWLNLIHVDDGATIILAVEQQAKTPALWNVCDGQPPLRSEYYRELARLLNGPTPQFVTPSSDAPVAQRGSADKRIANFALCAALRFDFAYPTYREGLAAIVAEEAQPR